MRSSMDMLKSAITLSQVSPSVILYQVPQSVLDVVT
jgi:hypothetical protein